LFDEKPKVENLVNPVPISCNINLVVPGKIGKHYAVQEAKGAL
jgi:hypothetical protein